jgi:hypothetical protein
MSQFLPLNGNVTPIWTNQVHNVLANLISKKYGQIPLVEDDLALVLSLNGIQGHASIVAGTNVTVTTSGQDIIVSSTGGGGTTGVDLLVNCTLWATDVSSIDFASNTSALTITGIESMECGYGIQFDLDGDLKAIAALSGTGYLQKTGVNTWSVGSFPIGGSNTQVQYNSSGALAGHVNFTYNSGTSTLNVSNLVAAAEVRTPALYMLKDPVTSIEGGQIVFQKPTTSGTLTGDVTFDLYQQSIRIFGPGGQGVYVDLMAQASGTYGSKIITTANANSDYAIPTRTISTTAPLSGGGNLSVDRTLSISAFTSGASGIVPASGGGTTNFLRADGTWAAPSTGGVAWGAITGTLSSQTDLQTALNGKQATIGYTPANKAGDTFTGAVSVQTSLFAYQHFSNNGTIGSQYVAYTLASPSYSQWNIGWESDRSFSIWSYNDTGSYVTRPVNIYRDGSAIYFTGRMFGNGGGNGIGALTLTTTSGTPSGGSTGDIKLVY